MSIAYPDRSKFLRPTALLLSVFLTCPLFAGCGGNKNVASQPPIDDTRGGAQTYPASGNRPQAKKGLSNTQKVAILAGAAALYYLYNQHKNKQEQGSQGRYYLSKNGRIYYRDAQGRAHWVTPPKEGIRVPEEEARQYQDFQGYNNRPTGRELTDLAPNAAPAQ